MCFVEEGEPGVEAYSIHGMVTAISPPYRECYKPRPQALLPPRTLLLRAIKYVLPLTLIPRKITLRVLARLKVLVGSKRKSRLHLHLFYTYSIPRRPVWYMERHHCPKHIPLC